MHYQKTMKIIWKNIALEWLFYRFLKFTLALIAAMLVLGQIVKQYKSIVFPVKEEYTVR